MAIIYLSGPMTGLPGKNHETFNRYAKLLRDRGHQVINPAENDGGSTDKSWSFYMELDISNLLVVDSVVVLSGWEFSTGAKIEVLVAQAIGRTIYRVEDFVQNKFIKLEPKVQVIVS
jgi:Domain of unknown function (DUF4406)